jgi:hypothetical protein
MAHLGQGHENVPRRAHGCQDLFHYVAVINVSPEGWASKAVTDLEIITTLVRL